MEPVKFHNTPALISMDEITASYISGYVDGEGCFCISFQPSKRHRFGWEVRPSFSVSQNADRAQVLYLIQREWRCGFIRPDRSGQTLKFEVRNVRDLVEVVIPHFRMFPLRSAEQADVDRFSTICRLVSEGRHLERSGFEQIVTTAIQMNPAGKRKYRSSEILSLLRSDERIVYATGNRGIS